MVVWHIVAFGAVAVAFGCFVVAWYGVLNPGRLRPTGSPGSSSG